MNALITQSNYIPWKGYFDSISRCDVFVIYDDMQYTRRDWRNRNYIKTQQGLQWITIPVEVKGKYHQKINETFVSDPEWNHNHWMILQHNYSKARFFREYSDWVRGLYLQATFQTLTEINVHFLKAVCGFFQIKTIFRDSREFSLKEGKTSRLVGICKDLGASNYFTGSAAKNYIEEDQFENENIKVHYFDYSGYAEYPQLFPPFAHGVCIWDLIFNLGPESRKYLKNIS